MLLGARTGAWSGGDILPYDAEVEYLQSSKTQKIDTGVEISNTVEMECSIVYTGGIETNDCGYVAKVNDTWERFHITTVGSGDGRIYYGLYQQTNGVAEKYAYDDFLTCKISASLSSFSVDGTSFPVTRGNLSETGITLFLFARNSNVSAGLTFANMKAKYFKIWKDGTLVRDFIPVRVGNVGYMYDKVSKTLFGNAGTGAFIVGPDVSAANGGV